VGEPWNRVLREHDVDWRRKLGANPTVGPPGRSHPRRRIAIDHQDVGDAGSSQLKCNRQTDGAGTDNGDRSPHLVRRFMRRLTISSDG